MEQKYWVPALERAHLILTAIARRPGECKMVDLCEETGINKSSMFSLIRTMEALEWVKKDGNETYSLGAGMAYYNAAFNELHRQSYNLVEEFMEAAKEAIPAIGETFQLSVLEGQDIVYLAKQEAPSLVKLESSPGMRFPAHATGMGKMLLAQLSPDELNRRFPDKQLALKTPHTITDWNRLTEELDIIRKQGYALDEQEVVKGICCVAAPVWDVTGKAVAAVSVSMLQHAYLEKREEAIRQVVRLAGKLSRPAKGGE